MRCFVTTVVWMYIFSIFGYAFSHPNQYESESTCPRSHHSPAFLHELNFQSSLPISSPSLPIEMDGDFLDKALNSSQKNVHTAVLFYAAWCPFSSDARQTFYTLSSMFPQIKHVMVEKSATMPSVFSRYAIHSLPSILIVNHTKVLRYHGQKDLHSLVRYYQESTGFHPIINLNENQKHVEKAPENSMIWTRTSLQETFRTDPYLVLSVAFVLLRAILYFFPGMASHAMALWAAYAPHLNIAIFGGSRQLLGHVLHLIDVKRICSRLKLCKNGNFHQGARSARVWASSLTSVSLGEASS
ncbi:unnamed protein product [Cuscuta campestris]|uniref:Thioredoxin domain-containing protein n=1 Tax=Cuscuta campestris TaxID=132261 RepID=A0A484LLL9_9ASTE|nr:unnamed protein product [Cuscuta campestris]